MADFTKFPFTTDKPQVEVTLPVGKHVLELVVEDSAGLRSAPDRVTITVVKEGTLPEISGIDPSHGSASHTIRATITGRHLLEATSVEFNGSGVSARVRRSTPDRISIEITIDRHAATGDRRFTVTTPAGTAQSPAGVTFTVATSITPVTPVTPISPVSPITPVTSVSPIEPVSPAHPVSPIEPISPIEPVHPISSPEPISPHIGPMVPREMPEKSAGGNYISLRAINGIGETSEEKLIAAGIEDVETLSRATPEKVASILGLKNPARAEAIIDEAMELKGKE